MAYDIFISYRRKGGADLARQLQLELQLRNYTVFLDYDELKDGKFDRRIMDAIDSAPIFLIVLSPHSLDGCVNEDDWVRKEIEHAIRKNRHIVPVNPDKSFAGVPDELPQVLREGLGHHQYSDVITGQMFKKSIEKLVEERIEPLLAKIGRAADAGSQQQVGALYHIETDMECRVLKFGEEIAVVHPGKHRTIRLRKGRHKLEIVSTECPDDCLSMTCTVEDNDMEDFISVELLPVREKRLQAEKAERERREAERKAKEEEEAERQRIVDMLEMVYVAGGTFTMGASALDSEADGDEKPAHSVTLSGYYIGKYEVTQKQWVEIMGSNPSNWKGDNLPMENVSWNEIQEFLSKLNAKTGKSYRLPTEAEWEFAARGGNSSRGYKYSGSDNIGTVAWYYENADDKIHPVKTHPVGAKSPNELGIYDMTGNVWEWCQDWFDSSYYSQSPSSNPQGPSSGAYRALRGGSWGNDARYGRISFRESSTPDARSNAYGFRLVLSE